MPVSSNMGDDVSRLRVLPFGDPCPFLPPAVQYYHQPALSHFWLCGGGERPIGGCVNSQKTPKSAQPIPTRGGFQEEAWDLSAQGNLKLSEQQEASGWLYLGKDDYDKDA